MLELSQIPLYICDDESLLRAVSHPSGVDEMGRVLPMAFRLKKDEPDISLSRLFLEELTVFLKRFKKRKFPYLSSNDVFYGAAELIAGDIRSLDEHIVLEPSPTRNCPSHASIKFKRADGSFYIEKGRTSEPVESSILGYEMALATIALRVYDKDGNLMWTRTEQESR